MLSICPCDPFNKHPVDAHTPHTPYCRSLTAPRRRGQKRACQSVFVSFHCDVTRDDVCVWGAQTRWDAVSCVHVVMYTAPRTCCCMVYIRGFSPSKQHFQGICVLLLHLLFTFWMLTFCLMNLLFCIIWKYLELPYSERNTVQIACMCLCVIVCVSGQPYWRYVLYPNSWLWHYWHIHREILYMCRTNTCQIVLHAANEGRWYHSQ